MTATSPGAGEDRIQNNIATGHAYNIVSVHEVEHQGKGLKLIRLRNPWGINEWQGDWSNESSKWTSKLKREVDFTEKDDGVFFIELNDYLDHFSWTSIAVENDKHAYTHS